MTTTTVAASSLMGNRTEISRDAPAGWATGAHAVKIALPEVTSSKQQCAALLISNYSVLVGATSIAALSLLFCTGWFAWRGGWLSPGSGFGYALGVIGGSMMLVLLLYPVRKRVRWMHSWGPLKYWFKFHMLAGVLGPVLVLFHSNFRVGSLNAGVALSSMILVVTSGLVGRFFYRRIHHGLYGSQATLKELQQSLRRQVELLEPMLQSMHAVKQEVDAFIALASHEPQGWCSRTVHFLTAGWKRIQAQRRVQASVFAHINNDSSRSIPSQTNVKDFQRTIDTTFRAVQRNIQFSSYERLFSLWHVVHIPFLCMLVITAVVHVVAVHIY